MKTNIKELNLEIPVDMLNSISQLTYKGIVIVNFYERNFVYISNNPFFSCGIPIDEIEKLGFDFYLQNVVEEDLPLLIEAKEASLSFLEKIPLSERANYIISHNFHLNHTITRKKLLTNHKLIPLSFSADGKVKLALCMISLGSLHNYRNIEIYKINHPNYWSYNINTKKWIENNEIKLKDTEKEMIILASEGLTIHDIANKMCKSIDTIKSYRKSIYTKLNVENITEAVFYVLDRKLI